MGLFGLGKKKKDEEKRPISSYQQVSQIQKAVDGMPELPEFPSLPEEEEALPEFPSYEPTVADIKKEVGGVDQDFEVPIRDKTFTGKRMAGANFAQEEVRTPVVSKASSLSEEKPLFVRIDTYRDAMHTLQALKLKLEDAEEVLRALDDVKSQEESKLEEWKKDLQNVKDKLLSIDRELFEV